MRASTSRLAAITAAVAFLVYFNSLWGGLVWDDETQIVKNQTIRSIRNLPQAFTSGTLALYANGDAATNYYRPLQTVAYMTGYALGGLSPFPYHALGVSLHIVTSLLVLLICLELAIPAAHALLGGLLFAAHPIHTEAVAWIAGIPDVICGAFYAASVWAALRHGNDRRPWWIWLSAVFYLGALLGKEMAITVPLVVLALLVVGKRLPRFSTSVVAQLMLPYAVAGGVYAALRWGSLGRLASSTLPVDASWADWLTLGVDCLGRYARYSVLPYPLVACHMIPLSFSDRIASGLASMAALAVLLALIFRFRKSSPEIVVWPILFFIMLSPVLFLKGISTSAFLAERYLYVPSIAVVVLTASASHRLRGRYAGSVCYALVGILAVGTIARNADWVSSERLYLTTLRDQPEVVSFRTSLAGIYMKRNEDGLAREYLESALQRWEDRRFVQLPFEAYRAHVGLGLLSFRSGSYEAAKTSLEKALQFYPRGDWAQMYLGAVYMESDNNYDEAIRRFERAIELDPTNEIARDYMGAALFNQGKLPEAVRYFSEALQINPTYADAQAHLRMAQSALQR